MESTSDWPRPVLSTQNSFVVVARALAARLITTMIATIEADIFPIELDILTKLFLFLLVIIELVTDWSSDYLNLVVSSFSHERVLSRNFSFVLFSKWLHEKFLLLLLLHARTNKQTGKQANEL